MLTTTLKKINVSVSFSHEETKIPLSSNVFFSLGTTRKIWLSAKNERESQDVEAEVVCPQRRGVTLLQVSSEWVLNSSHGEIDSQLLSLPVIKN